MGINGTLWGWHEWTMIHLKAKKWDRTYIVIRDKQTPEHTRIRMQKTADDLLQQLTLTPAGLPCEYCEYHCDTMMREHPPPQTPEEGSMFEYTVKIHNMVNKRLNKREWTVEEAWKALVARMDDKSMDRLDHARRMRIEDHAAIKEMQEKLDVLGLGDTKAQQKRILLFVSGFVLGLLLLGFIWGMVALRRG